MAEPTRFEHRMSDADALMWHIEQDPLLRSTITVIWRLDRPPDRVRLDDKVERISDGVGLVQMTGSLVERYRDRDPARPPKPMPPAPAAHVMTARERMLDALAHEGARQLARARRALGAVRESIVETVRHPLGSARGLAGTVASAARLLAPVSEPLSPILRGRSLSVRFNTLTVPLDGLKAAGKAVDATLNDAFVAAVAGGLRRYHEAHGVAVHALRMTMPINVRAPGAGAAGGNRFVPARFAVPVDVVDPLARMRAIRGLVRRQRGEPALGFLDDVSAVLTRLPKPLYTALFGSMLKGVDFVTSNVPGPPIEQGFTEVLDAA